MSNNLEITTLTSSSNDGNITISGNLVVTNTIYGTVVGAGASLDPFNPVEIGTGTSGTGATDSILIGVSADVDASSGIAIGKNAYVGGSATEAVAVGSGSSVLNAANAKGSSSVAVGRNTYTMSTAGVALGFNTTSSKYRGAAIGYYANTSGAGEGSLSLGRSSTTTGSTRSTAVGYIAAAAGTHGLAIGTQASASGIYSVAIGNGSTATATGAVAVGRNVSAGQVDSFYCRVRQVSTYNSAVFSSGGAGVKELTNAASSGIFKQDIQDIEDVGDKIDKMRVVRYRPDNYDDKGTSDSECIGLLAEELEEVFPEFVGYREDGVTPSNVNYHVLPSILIKEMQSLRKELDNLLKELENLEC